MLSKEEMIKEIDKLSQVEMAELYRFAPAGHPYFNESNKDVFEHFVKKFKESGGMTPKISKLIGWR